MLIIIDVQPRYKEAAYLIESEVVAEIVKAKRNNESIVVVLYGSRTRPLKSVVEALHGYKYLSVHKTEDDGGESIFSSLLHVSNRVSYTLKHGRLNLDTTKTIRVCGVNTSACVMKTVRSLSYLRFPVTVLGYACANRFPKISIHKNNWHHNGALARMDSWKNVEVVW